MNEKLDPNKFHTLNDKSIKILVLLSLIFVLVVLPIFSFFYYKFAVNRPSQLDKVLTFRINKGDSVSDVSGALEKEGALNSEFLFNLYVFLNRKEITIQAGTYTIPAGASILDLVEMFQFGKNDIKVTFLEGWRVEQFAFTAEQHLDDIDYQDFVSIAAEYEGYLFPDTYFINSDIEEEDLVDLLRQTFKSKTKDILTEEALETAGLTEEQAVIFASIVEREVTDIEDKKIVAGILIKRWRNGMKIDADATTQYAIAKDRILVGQGAEEIKWWPNRLTVDELSKEHPYNTRAVVGLPPTPICSPGLESLKSVIDYEDSPYFYYLTDKSGTTRFSVTLEEHNQKVFEYLSN